ncbi:hypothetical protein Syun_016024 [Stephania yunnanensis]|uniref:Hydrolase family protein / HAD-superfamily protein n=1 Tax=Stephania yunnanensis TaxID=152371 RepID=A0AAP0J417_9MAGN
MKFREALRVSLDRTRFPFFEVRSRSSRLASQSVKLRSERPCFGIAFDIDGVILGGNAPIGGSRQALKRLYDECGTLRVPYVFLTNGGGIPETKRARQLSALLEVSILPSQVIQGHSPFRLLLNRFLDKLIVAVGKGEPAQVMSEYGYRRVLSIDEYASYFDNIDPVSQYKTWASKTTYDADMKSKAMVPRYDVFSERVQAAFIVSDPYDWSRDIQVLCDILRSGGLPGKVAEHGHQLPLYFAADDLEYQAAFPSERLGMGAFRIALESIFNRIHPNALEYTSFGKPNSFVFKNAENVLKKLPPFSFIDSYADNHEKSQSFKTLYMIGDNPPVDIKGAKQVGRPWFSILTRTGVFKGKSNHAEFPADLVVDTVEEAVDFILKKESDSQGL